MTRTLEVNGDGVLILPADVLGGAKPRTRFRVEALDDALVLRPCHEDEQEHAPKPLTPEEWIRGFEELAAEISKEWKTDQSATEIVSEMRRW